VIQKQAKIFGDLIFINLKVLRSDLTNLNAY